MSEQLPVTPTEMSQAVVRLPYFFDAELQQQALADPRQLDPDVIAERNVVHAAVLRLVATEHLYQRQLAWEAHVKPIPKDQRPRRADWARQWRAGWQFTEERRQYIMNRHPLAVRRAGRHLMQLHNRGRFGENYLPLDRSVELVFGDHILTGYDVEPELVAAHLHRAGYQSGQSARSARQLPPEQHLYPVDAREYLRIFPPVALRTPKEHAGADVCKRLKTSVGTLEKIAREGNVFPVVSLDGTLREQEYYSEEAVEHMRAIIDAIPYIDPQLDGRLHEFSKVYGEFLVEAVIADLGASVYLRRHASRPVRCVIKEDMPDVEARLQYLTTLQPGEMGYDELAAALEITRRVAQLMATPEDRARARWLRAAPGATKRRGRTVFPPHVAAEMLRRRRSYLTPDLIPETVIVARYPQLVTSQRVINKLRRLPGEPVRLQLAGSAQPKKCRSWQEWRDMEAGLQEYVPADALSIRWDDLPRNQFELDEARIAYARELQALLSSPKHVDPTPIEVWLGQVHQSLGTFALAAPPEGTQLLPVVSRVVTKAAKVGAIRTKIEARVEPTAPPRGRWRRPQERAAPVDQDTPEPVEAPVAQNPPEPPRPTRPAFPAGERPYGHYGPSRAPLSPESAARYSPPRYRIVRPAGEIARRIGSQRLSAENVSEITGAPIEAIRSAVAARRDRFNKPSSEVRDGVTVECYEGAQLTTLLGDLVGLTPAQMARQLDLPEEDVAAYLRRTPARPSADGRYNIAMWERLRVEFRLAPPEHWPLTNVIQGMAESELVQLANSVGVALTNYYVRREGLRPHVGRTGATLLMAQFSRYYDEGYVTYLEPREDSYNRYELAEQADCMPEIVDAWMAPRVQTSRDMEWAQVRDEGLRVRNIRVLPHYSSGMCRRFLEAQRLRRGR